MTETCACKDVVEAFNRLSRAFSDPETNRMASVIRQKEKGFTGGGSACAWCGARALKRLENGHGARQCGKCGHASRIRVTVRGLEIEKVA